MYAYTPVITNALTRNHGVKVPSGLFVPGIICGSTFGRGVGEIVKSYMYKSQYGATCLGDAAETIIDSVALTSCNDIYQLKIISDELAGANDWCEKSECSFDQSVCIDSHGSPSGHCVFPGTYALIGACLHKLCFEL